MTRRPLPAILFMAAPIVAAGAEPLARYEQSQVHMGTQFRIVLYAPNDAVATKSAQTAFARIAELDRRLSDYRDDSELTLLSQASGGPPVKVSDELFFLLRRSTEISAATDGAFDVTAGPAIRLWRRARRLHELPRPEQIEAARGRVGNVKLLLDVKSQTVRLTTPQMLLDLGGIAKGYACDQALAALRQNGVTRALVDGGGDVSVSDPPPDKSAWTIAVAPLRLVAKRSQAPARPAEAGPPETSVPLVNAAIATSGDTERYVELGGKRYSHIVDPRTGWALSDRLQVTVVAGDGATADAFATAISVLGPEKGIALADATPNVAAFLIRASDRGIETFSSRGWNDLRAAAASVVPRPTATGQYQAPPAEGQNQLQARKADK